MNRFLPGMLVGLVLGGGGVYLGLERPWAGGEAATEAEEADAGAPAVTKKPAKRKRKKGKRRAVADDGEVVLTEAQTKLTWKGDAVALPERAVDMGSAGEGRALSGSEINDVIKRRSGAVIDCISEAAGNAPLKSAVTLKLLVDGGGAVTKIRVRAPAYLFEHGFYPCARAAASRMTFPATGGFTVVTAPFDIY